jgi:hypothetical protein
MDPSPGRDHRRLRVPEMKERCHEPAGGALGWQLQRGKVALGARVEMVEFEGDLLRLGEEGVVGGIGKRASDAIDPPV